MLEFLKHSRILYPPPPKKIVKMSKDLFLTSVFKIDKNNKTSSPARPPAQPTTMLMYCSKYVHTSS